MSTASSHLPSMHTDYQSISHHLHLLYSGEIIANALLFSLGNGMLTEGTNDRNKQSVHM